MGQMINRRRVYGGKILHEIEYLEVNSSSAIDTLINGGSNAEYELSAMITVNNARYAHLVGCDVAPKIYLQAGATTWSVQWDTATTEHRVNTTLDLNVKYKLSFLGGKFYVDDVEIASPGTKGYGDSNFTLFNASNLSRTAISRIYYCKMYKDGTLVRDLIPTRKGRTGYMYDRVSGTLFANVTGAPFVLGPDV